MLRKGILFVALVAVLAAVAGVAGTGRALAYGGKAVAQVEISGNCNNVSICPQVFGGEGGLWIWASLNSDGSADYTFNGCGHSVGNVGPRSFGPGGSGGGGPRGVPGEGTWTTAANLLVAINDGALPMAIAQSGGVPDFTVPYYEINLGGFLVSVPAVQGHYNFSFVQFLFGNAPGISFQTQVAP
jgi:hypothetical protein